MSNKTYDILKYLALIGLPIIAWMVGQLGETWGYADVNQIVQTINIIAVGLGGLLQISSHNYKKSYGDLDE